MKNIEVVQKILSKNDQEAARLKAYFKQKDIFTINLMSSPGSGKTTLLEEIAKGHYLPFTVIEGDLQTNRDAERLRQYNIHAHQITTGDACHLEASMITQALATLEQESPIKPYLFIENVGNLVCPASYDLGANMNIVLLSCAEGDDKILKYPTIFLCADAIIISKADLISVFGFNIEQVKADLAKLKKDIPLFILSCKDLNALQEFCDFLQTQKEKHYVSCHSF